jgi:hypothetical protein
VFHIAEESSGYVKHNRGCVAGWGVRRWVLPCTSSLPTYMRNCLRGVHRRLSNSTVHLLPLVVWVCEQFGSNNMNARFTISIGRSSSEQMWWLPPALAFSPTTYELLGDPAFLEREPFPHPHEPVVVAKLRPRAMLLTPRTNVLSTPSKLLLLILLSSTMN